MLCVCVFVPVHVCVSVWVVQPAPNGYTPPCLWPSLLRISAIKPEALLRRLLVNTALHSNCAFRCVSERDSYVWYSFVENASVSPLSLQSGEPVDTPMGPQSLQFSHCQRDPCIFPQACQRITQSLCCFTDPPPPHHHLFPNPPTFSTVHTHSHTYIKAAQRSAHHWAWGTLAYSLSRPLALTPHLPAGIAIGNHGFCLCVCVCMCLFIRKRTYVPCRVYVCLKKCLQLVMWHILWGPVLLGVCYS